MDERQIESLLRKFERKELAVEEVVAALRRLPVESLGHTVIDTHRQLRCGAEEVVFAEGKQIDQLRDIIRAHLERTGRVLLTRVTPAQRAALRPEVPELNYSPSESTAWVGCVGAGARAAAGVIGIVSAGTSDAPVAEEAECTARYFGCEVVRVNDVGVAGLHRLIGALPSLNECDGAVVIAGMDGALASVLSGLVAMPLVAVPTSVGYGAAFGGLAALLSMLVSCAPGVAAVNIDNGFGAVMALLRMLRAGASARRDASDRPAGEVS